MSVYLCFPHSSLKIHIVLSNWQVFNRWGILAPLEETDDKLRLFRLKFFFLSNFIYLTHKLTVSFITLTGRATASLLTALSLLF